MAHSLTDRRQGKIGLSEHDGLVIIEVLAEDHFIAGVSTLYRFTIDKPSWLPMEVEEFTPDGVPKRRAVFGNLRSASDIPDGFFRINGENPGHE
jgi:hypothetical protein